MKDSVQGIESALREALPGEVARNVARILVGLDTTRKAELVRHLGPAGREVAATTDGPAFPALGRVLDAPDLFPRMRELLDRPELFREPVPSLARLAWKGHLAILAAGAKEGKSTVAGEVVSAASIGRECFGVRVPPQDILVIAPDESIGATVRRLDDCGADPDRIRLLVGHPDGPLDRLKAELDRNPADVVLIDSLTEWARLSLGRSPDDGDSAGWGSVVRPLAALARSSGAGFLILHHARRSDGDYRGSTEILAAADAMIVMRTPAPGAGDPRVRTFATRARWDVPEWSAMLAPDGYTLVDGFESARPDDLRSRVAAAVAASPGLSRSAIARSAGGRKKAVLDAINEMVADGSLLDAPSGLRLPERKHAA